MERTITVPPAPYCFRVCLWSQCCILLLATLEWGQWRDRWQQMESQKCPSRYKDLATLNFLLGIWASRQLNLWTFLSVYMCLPVSSCQYPCLQQGHTRNALSYNESVWRCLLSHVFTYMRYTILTIILCTLHRKCYVPKMKTLGMSYERRGLMPLSSSKENGCLRKANLSLPSASPMCTK